MVVKNGGFIPTDPILKKITFKKKKNKSKKLGVPSLKLTFLHLKNGWLGRFSRFLLGPGLLSGANLLLVLGSVDTFVFMTYPDPPFNPPLPFRLAWWVDDQGTSTQTLAKVVLVHEAVK